MSKRKMASSRFVCLILVAMLTACSADETETSPVATVPDSGSAGDQSDATSPPDTAVRSGQTSGAEPAADLVTPDGWGPLRIGMSRAEVVAAAGEDAHPDAVGGPEPEQCDEFRPDSAPDGVLLMLERGLLTRVSVSRNSGIRTPEGFKVGDSASDVIAAYGSRALVEPHKYSEAPAKYITIWREESSDGNRRGIRYEIDPTGHVAHIRVGGPSIEYVEGCL